MGSTQKNKQQGTNPSPNSSTSGNGNLDPRQKIKDHVRRMLKDAEELGKRLPEIEAQAEEKISIAKSRLMQMEPFFAMLLFKLPTYPCYEVPTMGTDGNVLLYNPVFVSEKLLRKDVVFVLLHEIAHVFWKHCNRGPVKAWMAEKLFKQREAIRKQGKQDAFLDRECGEIEHKLKEWNFATDYTINHHIKKNVKVPVTKDLEKMLLFDEKLGDMTSEKVYEKIKTPYDPNQDPSESDPMGMGIGGILPNGMGELTEAEQGAL